MAAYVTVTGPMDGATAIGACYSCLRCPRELRDAIAGDARVLAARSPQDAGTRNGGTCGGRTTCRCGLVSAGTQAGIVSKDRAGVMNLRHSLEDRCKAFLSYSHAADGALAPRLQSALHRFAKPWNHVRAIRVFRDKTNLSVTPELWPS
jgi:hypothetical protein